MTTLFLIWISTTIAFGFLPEIDFENKDYFIEDAVRDPIVVIPEPDENWRRHPPCDPDDDGCIVIEQE